MKKPDFESVEDLKKVVRALSDFASAATLGRLFELTEESDNLFAFEEERLSKLALLVCPALRENPSGNLPFELEDSIVSELWDTRVAFMTIGIFLGAAAADPSGNLLARLGDGWVKSILAQPGYVHLKPSKENE